MRENLAKGKILGNKNIDTVMYEKDNNIYFIRGYGYSYCF